MITMLLLFIATFFVAIILFAMGKIKEIHIGTITLAGVVLFILAPSIVQKIPMVYNNVPYAQNIDAEIYYSQSENKYYKITDDEYWNIFDLYNVCEISEEEAKSYI